MKRFIISFLAAMILGGFSAVDAKACTGISLYAMDGSRIVARTVEWAAGPMHCSYVVVPRGHQHRSYTPAGLDGLEYKAIYGYVGIFTEYEPFVVEGINEAGLSAGLFFFPDYGEYGPYDPAHNDRTLCDMQFVSWVLSRFSTIDEVKAGIAQVDIVTLSHKIGSVHWRIAEPGGRMVVLEIVDGRPVFYENELGVLTNAPGFPWHMTNLNNYVNLRPGSAQELAISKNTGKGLSKDTEGGRDAGDTYRWDAKVVLRPLGHGSGLLGLPGDFTSPSRFVRAAFFQSTAPVWETGFETVLQAFHLLNNFDIPVGSQYRLNDENENMDENKGKDEEKGKEMKNIRADSSRGIPKGLPSATQFTAVTDQTSLLLYYRTAWNSNIRCIDLKKIDFCTVKYQSHPLDTVMQQPIEMVRVR
jgi:choloylglycine hydrolase